MPHRRAIKLLIPVITTLLSVLVVGPAMAAQLKPIRAAVINPLGEKDPFWTNTIAFMADAARDLGVTLEVHHAGGSTKQAVEIARQLVSRTQNKPQYLFYSNERHTGLRIVGLAERAGVYSIMIVSTFAPADVNLYGGPRQRYKHWLGEVVGDDYRGGYVLGKKLLQDGAQRRLHDGNRLGMHLVMSHREDALAQLRYQGIQRALDETPNAVLGQLGFAGWNYKKSIKETERLFTAWSNARLYAAESEVMALGVSNTISKRSRLQINVDVLVGSFGWSKLSLTSTLKSQITAVMGGHFIAGAAAVLLAHDHARGHDFAPKGISFKITQGMVNKDNVRRIAPLISPKNWDKIDFRKFSHYYFQNRTSYDFSIVTFLKEILQPS